MCACTLLLLPATACFLAGHAVCARQPDYHAAVLIGAAQARYCSYCDFDMPAYIMRWSTAGQSGEAGLLMLDFARLHAPDK